MVNTDFNQFRKKTLLLSRALHPRPMDATVITGHLARSLDRVAAVSFDIFDTLTTRLVYHPVDVFKFLPDQPAFKALQLPDTVDIPAIRVKAEHATYEAVNKETGNSNANLREIYRTFCEMVGKKPSDAEALVSAEEEVELLLAIPNEDGRLLFDEVRRAGKTVAYVSDTYHTQEFLARLLAHCGYPTEGIAMYSSCHHRRSKGEGKLFSLVLADLKLEPCDMLHIGDNAQSDHAVPSRLGLETLWHPFRAHDDAVPDYHEGFGPLHTQIKALSERMKMPRSAPVDFWYQLGYGVSGPLLSGFALWLRAHFEKAKTSRAYFLLRDGELIHQVYEILVGTSSPCPTRTLVSSRRAMVIPVLDLNPKLVLPQLFVAAPGDRRPVGDFLKRLKVNPVLFEEDIAAVGLGSSQEIIDGSLEQIKLIKLFKRPRLTQAIVEQARAERTLLVDFLRQEGVIDPGRVAFVDLGWHGSIQKAVSSLLQTEKNTVSLTGYYLGTTRSFRETPADEGTGHGYLFNLGRPKDNSNIINSGREVLENLCSSPDGSLFYFQRKGKRVEPIFDQAETDPVKLKNLQELHDGTVAFARDFKRQVDRHGWTEVPKEIAVENLLRLITRPTGEEAMQLGQVIHGENLGTRRGRPLAAFRTESIEPTELWEDYRNAYWKQGLVYQRNEQAARLRTLLWLLEDSVPRLHLS